MAVISLLVLCAAFATATAQPQLRLEHTGLPPVIGTVKQAGGKIFHYTYQGLYVLDNTSTSWRYVGEDTKALLHGEWIVHPSGIVVVNTQMGTVEFNTITETVTTHEGVFYQVRYSDTVVAALRTERSNNTAALNMVWLRWPSMDTIRIDTVQAPTGRTNNFVIPCADGSIIAAASETICRFHLEKQPQIIEHSPEIWSDQHYVYTDAERTHIVLTGRNTLIYSTNQFETASYISAPTSEPIRQVRLTADPDRLYIAHSGNIVRIDRAQIPRDTIARGLPSTFRNFDVLNETVIIGAADSIRTVSAGQTRSVVAGLPSGACYRLIALPDGLIGTGIKHIVAHPSGGEWSTLPLDVEQLLNTTQSSIIPMGGNSLDDFWCVSSDIVFHVNPRNTIEKVDWAFNGGYGARGLHTRKGIAQFTMLYAIEMDCGENQVVWSSGNSPDKTFLCRDGLRTLMVFNNADHVALTRDGIAYRTVDGNMDLWEQITIPEIASTNIMRTSVKGNHGLASVPGFMMWTHDAGRTWRSAVGDVYHSAITADGTVYTTRTGTSADSALIIERRRDDTITNIMVYDDNALPSVIPELRNAAFDDIEQRLYLSSNDWTVSLSAVISSVTESTEPSRPFPTHLFGVYDLFGRYVANDEGGIQTTGMYLRVDADGAKKVMIIR